MTVKIERMEDLFDEDIIDEMLEDCEEGCCHFNAANVCRLFKYWDCIDYVEGYIWSGYDYIGHAICSHTDGFGNIHYFDPTQEWLFRGKYKNRNLNFTDTFDVVKTFTYDEINEIFLKDGETHLVSVNLLK